MNAKTVMTTAFAGLLATAAHALTSEEIAAALDTDIGTFSLAGDAEWTVDTENSHKGSTCMRSGAITPTDGSTKTTKLTLTVDVKVPSRLSFWYKTSFYDTASYAQFITQVGAGSFRRYSGDWIQNTYVLIPGENTISWEFIRKTSSGLGSNCVWLDEMTLEPILEAPTKVEVTNVTCTQRYPWNGLVDIDYTVACEKEDAEVWVYPVGYDKDSNTTMAPRALSGDGVGASVSNGTFRMTWKVTDDYPNFHSTAFTVKMAALVGAAPYLVVDLSGGVDAISYPVSPLTGVPEGGWGDEYKTTKMVLRLVPAGSFMMGSPTDEPERSSYEDLHGVVLTKPFYMGVFECTQKQYELVMGANPVSGSRYKGDTRPVNLMSYAQLRGSVNGAGWPSHNQVDANSFMGRLRSKANMLFDLPTEAQWEYACRAGTSTGLNSGKEFSEENLKEVARCSYNYGNQSQYTAVVGSYRDNAWGLYDMHGNVAELCRDWGGYSSDSDDRLGFYGAIDPKGMTTPSHSGCRVTKGGNCRSTSDCRAGARSYARHNEISEYVGFRVMCSPVAE